MPINEDKAEILQFWLPRRLTTPPSDVLARVVRWFEMFIKNETFPSLKLDFAVRCQSKCRPMGVIALFEGSNPDFVRVEIG